LLAGIFCVLFAYALGSVLFGVVLGRLLFRVDLRTVDNPGASGTVRQFGAKMGVLVGLLDLAKGAASVSLAYAVGLSMEWMAATTAAVVLGHNWPVWFRFKGGGGLATGAGALVVLAPSDTLMCIALALTAGLVYRLSPLYMRVPLTSLPFGALFGLPALVWLTFYHGNLVAAYSSLAATVVVGIRGLTMLNDSH
jgi:acyl-phosphate glycerol 3-phosphate acyltransferase